MTTKPRIKIDLKKVEKLAEVCDSEEEIALNLGISYSTLRNRKKEFDSFDTAIKKGRANANIFVGGELMKAIKKGDTTAMIFYMKTRCKWRETNRTELTGANGSPVAVQNNTNLAGGITVTYVDPYENEDTNSASV